MTQALMPQTYAELERWAAKVAASDFVPKEYRGKPNDVLICVQYGNELGLSPVESLRSIAVINGKPSIYGDGLLALCQKSPVCEYIKESPILDKDSTVVGYICEAKRRGEDAKVSRFTMDDARKAKLAGKPGPWQEYPQRMLQMRARGFALRDAFADLLRGVITREEAMDYPPDPKPVSKRNDPMEQTRPAVSAPAPQTVDAMEDPAPETPPTPEKMIAKMQTFERMHDLRDYGGEMKPIYDLFSDDDRNRVNTEYKRLMKIFTESGT